MKQLLLLLISILSLLGCSQTTNDANKPKSSGSLDEILLVTDSLTWQSETGESIRKVVREAHPGVINPEPFFKVSFFPEEHFGGIFTKHHFIFIPTTLERITLNPLLKKMVSAHVVEKVKNTNSYVLFRQKDVFAQNQTILFLIAKEDFYLNKNFIDHKKAIQEIISNELMTKHHNKLVKEPTNVLLTKRLKDDYNISLHLPENYEVAQQENKFIWFRNVTPDADLNIFFTSKSYDDTAAFTTDSILNWRDQITHQYLFANKQDTSYMMRETSAKPLIKTRVDSTTYSNYLWGLWKIKNRAMGGSYISRTLKSNRNDQIYYIEGFVYAPGQEKLNYIRRLEAIIQTFEPGN